MIALLPFFVLPPTVPVTINPYLLEQANSETLALNLLSLKLESFKTTFTSEVKLWNLKNY
jgi:hypothetical protein